MRVCACVFSVVNAESATANIFTLCLVWKEVSLFSLHRRLSVCMDLRGHVFANLSYLAWMPTEVHSQTNKKPNSPNSAIHWQNKKNPEYFAWCLQGDNSFMYTGMIKDLDRFNYTRARVPLSNCSSTSCPNCTIDWSAKYDVFRVFYSTIKIWEEIKMNVSNSVCVCVCVFRVYIHVCACIQRAKLTGGKNTKHMNTCTPLYSHTRTQLE